MAKNVSAVKKKLAKGKNWYRIFSPKKFSQIEIGEALSTEASGLKNRIIYAQYSAISGDITKQHIKTKLKVTDVEGENVNTELIGYEMSKPFLQRFIRRKTSKIDQVVDIKLKDKNARLKAIIITVKKANASQRTALRKAIKAEILKNLREFDMEDLAMALASGRPQKMIQKKIKVIFPVRFFEIRKMEILPEKKVKSDLGNEKIEEVSKRESKHIGKEIKLESEQREEPKEEKASAESVPESENTAS